MKKMLVALLAAVSVGHSAEHFVELPPGRIAEIEAMLPAQPAGFGRPIKFWKAMRTNPLGRSRLTTEISTVSIAKKYFVGLRASSFGAELAQAIYLLSDRLDPAVQRRVSAAIEDTVAFTQPQSFELALPTLGNVKQIDARTIEFSMNGKKSWPKLKPRTALNSPENASRDWMRRRSPGLG